MKKLGLAMLVVLLGVCGSTQAIDRDARMIDTVALNVANLDGADSIGGSLWGETAIAAPRQDWAILFGGGYDEISPDYSSNIEAWTFGVGLKYYLMPLTSLGALGTYSFYDQKNAADNTDDKDAKAATAFVKQRFLPATDPLSPFARVSLTYRERSTFSDNDPALANESFSEDLFQFGGGVEFNMNTEFSFVLELGYIIANASDDNTEDLDGFVGSLGMQYYWD